MSLDRLPTNKVDAQITPEADRLPSTPAGAAAHAFLVAKQSERVSPKTLRVYGMVLRDFTAAPFPFPPSRTDIRLYLLSLEERKLSPHTQHIYFRTLRTWFNWLLSEGLLASTPLANVKRPRLPKLVVQPFTDEEIRRLLLVCSGNHFVDVRNYAIILMFLDTGLRLSEFAGIKLGDVNLSTGRIRVRGKGAKERLVRIGVVCRRALVKYLTMRTDDHDCLWVSEERRPLTAHGISSMLKQLCRLAGITRKRRGAHTFRHTSAMAFLRKTNDRLALQELLGHSTLEMTRHYTRAVQQEHMLKLHEDASPADDLLR